MYNAPGLDVQALGEALVQWFRQQGFEAQLLQAPPKGYVVQARKGGLGTLVGMAAALNVTMTQQAEMLTVQMGAAQWSDKAVAGAVGALIFWPVLIPAAFGAWKQKQLPEQVFGFIDQYIAFGGQATEADLARITAAPSISTGSGPMLCPSCKQPVRAGAKFCEHCGASLVVTCPKCGAALRPDAKFCDVCGAAVAVG